MCLCDIIEWIWCSWFKSHHHTYYSLDGFHKVQTSSHRPSIEEVLQDCKLVLVLSGWLSGWLLSCQDGGWWIQKFSSLSVEFWSDMTWGKIGMFRKFCTCLCYVLIQKPLSVWNLSISIITYVKQKWAHISHNT